MVADPGADDELIPVLDILDGLEELISSSRRLPFTSTVAVNEEDILEAIDRIRVGLPDDLREARHLLEDRARLVERAQREAEELAERSTADAERRLRDAEARVEALLAQHAVTREAEQRAAALLAEAEAQAADQRGAADDYAREVMQRLEEQLDRWLGTVREGLQALPGAAASKRRRRR